MQGNKKRFFGIVLVALAMVGFYVVTRLTNLTALPIFTDEAIYIRWSQIGSQDANWRFISLTDGKQPMFTWVIMMLLKLVDADPLFVGRLTSVVAGFGTLLGIWAVTYILFTSVRVAFVASALYLCRRLRFCMTVWRSMTLWCRCFRFGICILRLFWYVKADLILHCYWGYFWALGCSTKAQDFLASICCHLAHYCLTLKRKRYFFRLVRFVGLVVVSFVLSQAVYSVLRLSPFFHMVGQKDSVFLFTLSEWFDQPFRYLVGNMRGMFDWLRSYLTLPIFIASFAPLFFITTKWRERLVLYMWWAIPFVGLATFAKVLYPRFTLFMTIPLFIVAADTIVKIWERMRRPIVKVVFVFVLIVPSSMVSYVVIRDPWNAPLPFSDRAQYLEDWPSGWGIPHVVSFLKTEANNHHITVFTDGTFGLLPYALEIYLVSNPNITIVGIWPLPDSVPTQVIEAIQKGPTYLVLNEKQTPPKDWYVTLLGQYEKGKREGKYMRLYTIELPPSHIL